MTGAPAARVPVSIFTGFLGSGKTTLLNRLLRQPGLDRTAVIVNEFGEIGLDHLLMETPNETAVLLDNGCICCTVRGDLVETLRDLMKRRGAGSLPPFDRLLIETTGLADPVPIIQTLVTDAKVAPRYRFDGTVTLVDAVNGAATLDAHPEAVKQAALADRILVSKTDLADAERVAALHARLHALNPAAPRRLVAHGAASPADVFDVALGDEPEARMNDWLAAERPDPHHAHRAHGDGIRTISMMREAPVTRTGLALWLNMLGSLKGAQLLRCKGLLNVEGRPVAVHAVQTVIHEPIELSRWPDDERRSRFVFITRHMPRAALERTLDALGYDLAPAAAPLAIDPDAYARFVSTAQRFR